MGFAVARAAAEAGARVTLVAGPVHLPTPRGVRRIDVQQRAADARRGAARGAAARRLRRHRRSGRLAPGGMPPSTRSRRTALAGRADASNWPRTPTSWPPWPRLPQPAPVLRGLRRREPRPRAPRAREAGAQGRAADGGNLGPGHLRPRRQHAAARRCTGRARTAPRRQADAGARSWSPRSRTAAAGNAGHDDASTSRCWTRAWRDSCRATPRRAAPAWTCAPAWTQPLVLAPGQTAADPHRPGDPHRRPGPGGDAAAALGPGSQARHRARQPGRPDRQRLPGPADGELLEPWQRAVHDRSRWSASRRW